MIALRDAAQRPPDAGVLRLLLAEQERSATLHGTVEDEVGAAAGGENLGIEMAVGPEGGWTAEEESLFAAEGWKPVSLGPRNCSGRNRGSRRHCGGCCFVGRRKLLAASVLSH